MSGLVDVWRIPDIRRLGTSKRRSGSRAAYVARFAQLLPGGISVLVLRAIGTELENFLIKDADVRRLT